MAERIWRKEYGGKNMAEEYGGRIQYGEDKITINTKSE